MSTLNGSTSNNTQSLMDQFAPMKAFLLVTPCVIFLYVNGVMIFTLRKKTVFQQTSRYILFGQMLWVDTLNLFMSVLLYLCAISRILIMKNVCLLLLIAATSLYQISTLNLSLMSLERYVAICFPLRHAEFTSFERTHIAIGVICFIGMLQSLSETIIFYCIDTTNIAMNLFCSRTTLLRLQIYNKLDIAFTSMYFALASFVIIFTYASISAVAKTAACDKMSAQKANKTVLLHLIQLGLGASSILAGVIQEVIYVNTDLMTAINVMYFCFVVFIMFPKCLSPLIYGMRDQAFSCIFLYYFTFGKGGTVNPVIKKQHA
ncbi:odorant receptor, family 93, subfamily A, member 6 [Danio rerio]|uniref:Odorant receptor, family 93, subfamily A, member 6 n=1 Tax=Danio rerio TaxID=7955 RepID=A0AB13A8L4_DANRE|nr:odorant receptor, family 93, subfamily A, member 6 [Danio rerio]ABC43371.1 odorant receptor [Danio rerio]